MRHIFLGTCRRLWICMAILIIAVAIFISIARIVTPVLARHQSEIAGVMARAFHSPVKIGKVAATWHLFQPMFQLDNVRVYSDDGSQVKLIVKRIYVGVDLIKSLLAQKFEPGTLIIVGAKLSIRQLANGKVVIEGLETDDKDQDSYKFSELLKWLSLQRRIAFHDIYLKITQKNGTVSKGYLNLSFRHHSDRYRAKGYLSLHQGHLASRLNFVMDAKGNLSERDKLRAKLYLSGGNINLQQWLVGRHWHGYHIAKGALDFQSWGNWHKGKWKSFDIKFGITHGLLTQQTSRQTFPLTRASGEVIWHRTKAQQWLMTTKDLKIITQQPWPVERITAKGQGAQLSELYIHYLPMKTLRKWIDLTHSLPKNLQTYLQKLKPQGEWWDTQLRFQPQQGSMTLQQLSTQLKGLSWQHWRNIPSVHRINVNLVATPKGGEASISGQQVKINMPQQFDQPFQLQRLVSQLKWRRHGQQVQLWIPQLQLNTKHEKANASGKVIFTKGQSPMIELVASGSTDYIRPQLMRQYLPQKILDPKFNHWINHAVKAGGSAVGQFVWRGPLQGMPYDKGRGVMSASAHFYNASIKFDEDWPMATQANGIFTYNGRDINIVANQAESLGSKLSYLKVDIPNIHKDQLVTLYADGQVSSDFKRGIDYIAHSPLKKMLGDDLTQLSGAGKATLSLHLAIPIAHHPKDAPVKLRGQLKLLNDKVDFPAFKTKVGNITGTINITEQGVNADNVQMTLLGHQAKVRIYTENQKQKAKVHVVAEGKADASYLNQIARIPMGKAVKGKFQYRSHLIYSNDDNIQLTIRSDLKNLAIDIPKPFYKVPGEPRATYFQLNNFQNKQYRYSFGYGRMVAGQLLFSHGAKQEKFVKGHIHFGVSKVHLPVSQKLIIDGNIQYGSIEQWQQFLAAHASQQSSLVVPKILANIHIAVAKVNLFNEVFHHVTFSLEPKKNTVNLSLQGDDIAGTIYFPRGKDQLLQARFHKLYLQPIKQASLSQAKVMPTQLPPMIINCEDLRYGDRNFGHVGFETSRTPQGLVFDKIVAFSKNYTLTAKGKWYLKGQQSITHLQGTLSSNKLSEAFQQWQLPSNLHNEDAQVNFNLAWPGSPFALSPKGLQGYVNLRFGEGYIDGLSKSADAKMGFGRVLSLLSLQSLPRRLTLNFNDLVHKGFYYERIRGDFTIRNGNAETNNTYMDGSVAYVALNGAIDLHQQRYNLRLFVAPHITSSLPVVAAIAGGPVVGGITWVVNKMITPEVQRIAHYTYLVQGPWDKPEISKV